MDDLTDLVHAAVNGDQSAWRRLVEAYLPLVKSVIRAHGLSGPDAEDITQVLWLRLVEHLKDLREPRALPGWIKTTTRNECIRLLKATRRTVPISSTVEPQEVAPVEQDLAEDLLRAERHQAILAALAELPENQRNLLVLLAADPPLSYAEIGRRLDMPPGSIGPTRGRALSKLREFHAVAALIETNSEAHDDHATTRR